MYLVTAIATARGASIVRPIIFSRQRTPNGSVSIMTSHRISRAVRRLIHMFHRLASHFQLTRVIRLDRRENVRMFKRGCRVTLMVECNVRRGFRLFGRVVRPLMEPRLPLSGTSTGNHLNQGCF